MVVLLWFLSRGMGRAGTHEFRMLRKFRLGGLAWVTFWVMHVLVALCRYTVLPSCFVKKIGSILLWAASQLQNNLFCWSLWICSGFSLVCLLVKWVSGTALL